MSEVKSPEEYLAELQTWKLTALRLSPSGRFLGYDRRFLEWIGVDLAQFLSGDTITSDARKGFEEARRRIELENDDLFPDICARLHQALSRTWEVAYEISRAEFEEFKEMCEAGGSTPEHEVQEMIRIRLLEKRRGG